MTTGSLEIRIVGDDAGVQHMLERMDSSLSPAGLATFLGVEVGPYIKERVRDRFKNEGDEVVGKWLPLSPATVQMRQAMGYGGEHPINVRTHDMELYMMGAQPRIDMLPIGASLRYPGVASGSSKIGAKIKTAQVGATNPQTPPRPIMGLGERDLEFILTALALDIKTGGGRYI